MIPARLKFPGERKPITFDFTSKLRPGDSLVGTATATADAGLTLDGTDSDLATGLVNVFVKDGLDGHAYRLTCQHDTAGGEILMLAMTVEVRTRDA